MNKTENYIPINRIVEPDFLNYLQTTFKEWQRLAEQKTPLGSRMLSKTANIIEGARLNAHNGFTYSFKYIPQKKGENNIIRLQIFTSCNKHLDGEPQYTFETEIYNE